MLTPKDEYSTLRQELLEHQNRRLVILSGALTVCVALFAASVQFKIAFLPLLALVILHFARVQIYEAQGGVARIAAYIRIILEDENPSLKWETGSFWIRGSVDPGKSGETKNYSLSPLEVLDNFILWTGRIAILISVGQAFNSLSDALIASKTVQIADVLLGRMALNAYLQTAIQDADLLFAMIFYMFNVVIILVAVILWLIQWRSFTRKNRKLVTLKFDEDQANKWENFKIYILSKRAERFGNRGSNSRPLSFWRKIFLPRNINAQQGREM